MPLAQKGKEMASKIVMDAIQEQEKEHRRSDDKKKSKKKKDVKKDDPVDDLVILAAAGIGIVSEAIHHHKEKKKLKAREEEGDAPRRSDATASSHVSVSVSNRAGREGQNAAAATAKKPLKGTDNIARAFLTRHWSSPDGIPSAKLALPVILPQRRPESRSRGFVRAYSAMLADTGISQDTFLDFIDTLNNAIKPNEWFNALNLADLAGMAVPEPAMMLVGVAAGMVADASMEAQGRAQTNKFMDIMNAQFFGPRGLMCLVVTWSSEGSDSSGLAGVNCEGEVKAPQSFIALKQTMTSTGKSEAEKNGMQDKMQKMLLATRGALTGTACAPLIFPSSADETALKIDGNNGKKKGAMSRGVGWLDDYMDKHARDKWIEQNQEHPMASMIPRPEFQSRYADRSHPARSGDVGALLSGGRWQLDRDRADNEQCRKSIDDFKANNAKQSPKPAATDETAPSSEKARLKQEEKEAKKTKKAQKEEEKEARKEKKAQKEEDKRKLKAQKEQEKREEREKDKSLSGTLSGLLHKDQLYLVIMNRPSLNDPADTTLDMSKHSGQIPHYSTNTATL